MPGEIKFTTFGIPYLVEFANISIRSPSLKGKSKKQAQEQQKQNLKGKENKPKLPPPPVRCPTCGHLPSHPPVPAVPDTEADVEKEALQRPGGLYIRFQSQDPNAPATKISDRRLVRLRWTIANAVTKAGMTTPSPAELSTSDTSSETAIGTGTVKSASSTKSRALYKGTYGQVKEALKEAGLSTTPCDENGFEHATRLGALFVVNSKAVSSENVELTKVTLWG